MFKTSPILVSPIPILISSSSYHPVSFFFLQPFNLLGFLIKGFTFTISRYSHSLLDPLLSDFQPYHFSETACIKITNEVCVIRSNNFFSNLILFSLVATFDTSTIPFILKCFHSLNSVLYNIPVFLLHVCLFLLVYFVRSSLPSHSFNIGRLFLFYRCNFIQSHGLGSHLYDDLQISDLSCEQQSCTSNSLLGSTNWISSIYLVFSMSKTIFLFSKPAPPPGFILGQCHHQPPSCLRKKTSCLRKNPEVMLASYLVLIPYTQSINK